MRVPKPDDELKELADTILMREKPVDLPDVGYKGHFAVLNIALPRLMQEAVTLRRKKVALNRTEAVEGAYDYLLHLATKGEYERTGEVWVDKTHNRATAFCAAPEDLLLV